MKIAIDLDRTIFDCSSLVFHIGNSFPPTLKNFDRKLKYKLVDPVEAKFFLNNLFFLKMSHSKNFHQVGVSVKILQKWATQGFEIEFVSSRPDFKAFRKATINWLERHNIKFKKLIFACNNKPKYCQINQFDVLIDDMLSNCIGAELFGTKAIWLKNKYNKNLHNKQPKNICGVNTWEEIDNAVQKLNQNILLSPRFVQTPVKEL